VIYEIDLKAGLASSRSTSSMTIDNWNKTVVNLCLGSAPGSMKEYDEYLIRFRR
jgi:hypothetical protein